MLRQGSLRPSSLQAAQVSSKRLTGGRANHLWKRFLKKTTAVKRETLDRVLKTGINALNLEIS